MREDRPVGIPRKRAPRPKPGVTWPSRWSGKGGSGREGPTRVGRSSRDIGAMKWMGGAEVMVSRRGRVCLSTGASVVSYRKLSSTFFAASLFCGDGWLLIYPFDPDSLLDHMRSLQRLSKITRPQRSHLHRSITSSSPLNTLASSSLSTPSLDYPLANDDFHLYPAFFNLSECRQLITVALWKLDRLVGSRRHRRTTSPSASPDGSGAQSLQELFHGEYGFEEVRHFLLIAPSLSWISKLRDTLIRSLIIIENLYSRHSLRHRHHGQI